MKKSILLLLITISCINLMSQETDSVTIQRIEKLEKIIAKLPKLSGFIDFRYQYSPDFNTFDVRRARLDLKGDIGKMIEYRLQVDFAPSPKVLDAYAGAKVKNWFNVRAGSFKTPFSLENPYSPKDLEFIDNAMAINKLAGYQDISGIRANGRDVGIMIYGGLFGKKGFDIISYSIGVFNGAGINVLDNNKDKDVVGKIDICPIRSLTLSASAYIGTNAIPETDIFYGRRDRYAFGLQYSDAKFIFRTEYLNGLTTIYNASEEKGKLQRSQGVYAIFGYTFLERMTPAIRFDLFQDDIHAESSRKINYTAAFSYWVNKHFRLQLNYTYQTFYNKEKNGSLVAAMMTAAF